MDTPVAVNRNKDKPVELLVITEENSSIVQQDDHQFRNKKKINPVNGMNPYEKLQPPTEDLKINSRVDTGKTTISPF